MFVKEMKSVNRYNPPFFLAGFKMPRVYITFRRPFFFVVGVFVFYLEIYEVTENFGEKYLPTNLNVICPYDDDLCKVKKIVIMATKWHCH